MIDMPLFYVLVIFRHKRGGFTVFLYYLGIS